MACDTHCIQSPGRYRSYLGHCLLLVGMLAAAPAHVGAEGAGQTALDEATQTKLLANNLNDLDKVVELCEQALQKGLDAQNEVFARTLLTGTLYEKANRISEQVFRQPPNPRWPALRQLAIRDLEKALQYDPNLGEVHLLIARLQALAGGDDEQASKAVEKAIALLQQDEDQEKLSTAWTVHAGLQEDREKQLEDLNKAILLDPRNVDAWRARGLVHLAAGDAEKALEDFQTLLERDPEDYRTHQAIAGIWVKLNQYDQALKHLNKVIELHPDSAVPHALRAQILEEKGDIGGAIESLNEAVKAEPQNLAALLARARLRLIRNDFDLAQADLNRVLQLRPGLRQAIFLRSIVSAAQNKFGDAIRDMQQLLRESPEDTEMKMRLAEFYVLDGRAARGAELYAEVIQQEPENWQARRGRGDALLNLGKQAEAIAEYEAALQVQPEDSGLLNNLAWVLATSPDEQLRNGQRALELAVKASEVTDYKAAHILSTLAAAHAEVGNIEEAIKWSKKAVELDSEDEHLQKELEHYQTKRQPWREAPQPSPPEPRDADDTAEDTGDTEETDDAEDSDGAGQ